MEYVRGIRYLEYWEQGERFKSVGFIKEEIGAQSCTFQIRVTGLAAQLQSAAGRELTGQVCLAGITQETRTADKPAEQAEEGMRRIPVSTVKLQDGRGGTVLKELRKDNLAGGISYADLREIAIELGNGRWLRCFWNNPQRLEQQKAAEEKPGEVLDGLYYKAFAAAYEEQAPVAYDAPRPAPPYHSPEPSPSAALPRPESKWQQLKELYQPLMPGLLTDESLSLQLKDLVILPEKYYDLGENSFLRHGFCRYHHLALMRTCEMGRTRYYLGIPGKYCEQERRAAILFGCDSFEGDREPAREGDFGYYMTAVEL